MKLRIKGNSLRLRLQQGEVRRLRKGEAIVEETQVGEHAKFLYALEANDTSSVISVTLLANHLRVTLPTPVAHSWADSEQISILAEQGPLKILVEKDFACLKPRSSPQWEDESDAFPNPNPTCGHSA